MLSFLRDLTVPQAVALVLVVVVLLMLAVWAYDQSQRPPTRDSVATATAEFSGIDMDSDIRPVSTPRVPRTPAP